MGGQWKAWRQKVLRFVHIHLQHISRMLLGFLNGLAEHLGLRSRENLLVAFDSAGLNVVGRLDTKPTHPRRHLFTSESVAEDHQDKIADQISDAILDAFLSEEPWAKVVYETLVFDNLVVITGEFKTVRKELFDEVRDRTEAIARQYCATSAIAMPRPA